MQPFLRFITPTIIALNTLESTSHRYRGEGEVIKGDSESEKEEEVGSEEEAEFLAAVAVEETIRLGIEGMEIYKLDFLIRSHILLAVIRGELTRRGQGGGPREALRIIEPYVRIWQGVWPNAEQMGEMLRRILVENAQLFARWRVSPLSKQFAFELGPRE
ncbi:hypothetical protein N7507_003692 [Penicillium longicatenatum]|nr:hypothetical protein N7507_003692 [Penicillium longicatenatum]